MTTELQGDSNSIKNQKAILQKYANDNGFRNTQFFVDDGYSGTTFDRPDWQRLSGMIDEGQIGTLIVKDMSRLGRDYLQVGMLTEMVFPNADVRFTAINNGVDSINGTENDMTPFVNLFNEFYAKDTSRKIRAVFKAKGNSGKPLCTNPLYGYIKDPEDKLHWIIDEEAAEVVREIFHLCVQGYGVSKIANILTAKHIMNPTAHAKANGINPPDNRSTADNYTWADSTISHMLTRQEYIGNTVNFKTYRKSYKQKKQLKHSSGSLADFRVHFYETIITRETFDIVQMAPGMPQACYSYGEEMPIVLRNAVLRQTVEPRLYQVRHRGWAHDKEHFVCATYRKVKGGCSSHQIRNVVVEELLLDSIRNITAFAREHEDEFMQMVTDKTRAEVNKSLRDDRRELEQAQSRAGKLDGIIQKLYEDNIDGKISDERFYKMSASYEEEQKTLEARIKELKAAINAETESAANVNDFLKLVRKYTDIQEFTAEVIREFVEKIYVYKAERIDGKRTQRIKIVWNCIGEFTLPQPKKNEKSA